MQAQPPTFLYVASKFARRHRVALTTTAGLLLVAICGTALSFYRIDLARREAITQKIRATAAEQRARIAAQQALAEKQAAD